jgi:hypothetical protein
MDADHEWIPVVFAADCQPCPGCGDPQCPRCQSHYADCPCPGPHQTDLFYYRSVMTAEGQQLQAIPRDAELDRDEDREPDDQEELRREDDYEGPEPDNEDPDEESLFDRIEPADWDDGPDAEPDAESLIYGRSDWSAWDDEPPIDGYVGGEGG